MPSRRRASLWAVAVPRWRPSPSARSRRAKELMRQFWASFDEDHYMIVAHRPDLATQK